MSKKNLGSSIDDFLKKEDVFEEAQARAIKEVVAWRLAKAGGGYPKADRGRETGSARNSLKNKDFTSNPLNLKDLAGLVTKSLIPIDRREGGEAANGETAKHRAL
jgi:hypothetical protein